MPPEALEGLARTIFEKIRGEGDRRYLQSTVDYLSSEEFLRANKPKYLGRCKGLQQGPRFEADLSE